MAAPIDFGAVEAARHGIRRSAEWPRVEREHLVLHPRCICCALAAPTAGLQVHHVFPFHICILLGRPELELDERNLVTLCESEDGRPSDDHHLLVGHVGDFQSSNLEVEQDARVTFHGLTAAQLRADPRWEAKVASRMKPFDQLTPAEKQQLVQLMNQRFPRR